MLTSRKCRPKSTIKISGSSHPFPMEADTRNGGATRPRVHLGGDYFVVLYSGNNFKSFHFFFLLLGM